MIKGSVPVTLIFKISYKAMIFAFSTQHKFQSKRDETLLLQTDLSKANTVIPKLIQWKDINLLEEWILEGATAPVIPKQLEPNTELQNVTQYSGGKVKLSFKYVLIYPLLFGIENNIWLICPMKLLLTKDKYPLKLDQLK